VLIVPPGCSRGMRNDVGCILKKTAALSSGPFATNRTRPLRDSHPDTMGMASCHCFLDVHLYQSVVEENDTTLLCKAQEP
jgi:hypothetical protein